MTLTLAQYLVSGSSTGRGMLWACCRVSLLLSCGEQVRCGQGPGQVLPTSRPHGHQEGPHSGVHCNPALKLVRLHPSWCQGQELQESPPPTLTWRVVPTQVFWGEQNTPGRQQGQIGPWALSPSCLSFLILSLKFLCCLASLSALGSGEPAVYAQQPGLPGGGIGRACTSGAVSLE